ncbi:S-adenosyl-L-methionine-dependent methyltransferase [Aspergillus stella-maris]|uniref:S-adenosyl-L-methionine-dependent methyltransferase n=1 Tax=Aspergillus stella-maris TaxID=1810926 RepID=UPI003CCCEBCC
MSPHFADPVVEPTTTPLEDLSVVITKSASIVTQYLQANGHPQPSLGPDGPSSVLPSGTPRQIVQAHQQLIAASLQIFQLAIGPSEFLPHLANGFQYVSGLTWLCNYRIFHLVPLTHPITYETLSQLSGVPIPRLKSIIRFGMTTSLFTESPDGLSVSHTATSAHLARDEDAYNYATYLCSRTAPTALHMTDAHKRWGVSSTATNQTAYNAAFDTYLPFFEDLKHNPGREEEFARLMKSVRSSEALSLRYLVAGVDLGFVMDGGRVVDVGGSTGSAAIALAKAHPTVNFTVQDLPSNIEAGAQAATSLPTHIQTRLEFQPHDFTTPNPVQDAEAYLLRMILHDWADAQAINILRNIVCAMNTHSRLFIMDIVLPVPGSVPMGIERIARARDLTMMQMFNSKERELGEWVALLGEADERLRLVGVKKPFGSALSVLEVRLEADESE